jgi:hypothetical protein
MQRMTLAHVVKAHLEPSAILTNPQAHELAHQLFQEIRRARRELDALPGRS